VPRATFPILRELPNGHECETDLHFNLTDEGLIVDLIDAKGEVIDTWGATAQEFYEDIFLGDS
jgi:hypothetical protein